MPFVTSENQKSVYDVIVVGSGAAGGQSAYTLCMDGAKVLMLEAGRNYDPDHMLPVPAGSTHIATSVPASSLAQAMTVP